MSAGWLLAVSVLHGLLGSLAAMLSLFATGGAVNRRDQLHLSPGPLAWVGEHSLYAVLLLWLLSLAALWLLHRQGLAWRSVLVCLPPYGLLALYLWHIERFV